MFAVVKADVVAAAVVVDFDFVVGVGIAVVAAAVVVVDFCFGGGVSSAAAVAAVVVQFACDVVRGGWCCCRLGAQPVSSFPLPLSLVTRLL